MMGILRSDERFVHVPELLMVLVSTSLQSVIKVRANETILRGLEISNDDKTSNTS